MKVQEVRLEDNKKRYMLLNEDGFPIIPAMKYLKYIDTTGKSYNTQKTYCYALKNYFEYLNDIGKEFNEITISDLSNFVAWLKNPYKSLAVSSLYKVKPVRTAKTINLTITAVMNLYDYLFRIEEIENNISDVLTKNIFLKGPRQYKGFLHHINKDNPVNKNILKVKISKTKLKVLTKDEVIKVYKATTNIRDRFLIKLLFETGLRIGEALSLFVEDFVYDNTNSNGHKIKLVDRGELENGAKLKTGERDIFISKGLMDLFDDYEYEVLDELDIDTNFVFVKLKGENKGKPMDYDDVSALFKKLKSKTGLNVYPHLFRHTSLTAFYQSTKDIKATQERAGHAQLQTTMNLYVHPSDEDIRDNWDLAQATFQDILCD